MSTVWCYASTGNAYNKHGKTWNLKLQYLRNYWAVFAHLFRNWSPTPSLPNFPFPTLPKFIFLDIKVHFIFRALPLTLNFTHTLYQLESAYSLVLVLLQHLNRQERQDRGCLWLTACRTVQIQIPALHKKYRSHWESDPKNLAVSETSYTNTDPIESQTQRIY